jgi:2-polyprenyl-3-methyl-5-hydroxy-6-metoxy-1,4-benzoquinol methylase
MSRPAWNHNTHYQRLILRALPSPCHNALDVGCGVGLLTRRLSDHAEAVTGIDRHGHSIAEARAQNNAPTITYLLDDFMTHPFELESFDAITSVAAFHHMPIPEALARMRMLLRPGGTLALVEIAQSRFPQDLGFDVLGAVSHRLHRLTKKHRQHPSPVLEPTMSYAETRAVIEEQLPGARYRRLALWRYSVVWQKPSS